MAVSPDRIGNTIVVKLADAGGEIALLAKSLRQTDPFGATLAKDLRIRQNTRGIWIEPCEQRIAAWSTQWKRAVGALEPYASGGELVDIGRLDLGISVTAEHVVQVIRDDEQDIRLSCLCGAEVCNAQGSQAEVNAEQQ